MRRWTLLLTLAASGWASVAHGRPPSSTIYYFIDTGGEHPYPAECVSGSAMASPYSEFRGKLQKIPGGIGKHTASTECCEVTHHFFLDKKACDAALAKASAWYKKELPKEKPKTAP